MKNGITVLDVTNDIPTIYVGYDSREDESYEVLKYTAKKYASGPINVYPIKQDLLRRIGLYRRERAYKTEINTHQYYDIFDGKPFATDFSFSRFLTPFLHRLEGWALFMDCDMYFRSDPLELFEKYNNSEYAIYCVKHDHVQASTETHKMYGNEQYYFTRKNWSSFIMYNCSHKGHNNFTVDDVNTKTGRWLHNFKWLDDTLIGELPEEWNWLDGHSSVDINAKNVHFTRGGPWFRTWKPLNEQSQIYAQEWKLVRNEYRDFFNRSR